MQVAREEGYVVEEADDDDGDDGSERVLDADALALDGPSSFASEGLQARLKEKWGEDDLGVV